MNFGPSDLHRLEAARGWLDLGNHVEANEELGRIEAKNCADLIPVGRRGMVKETAGVVVMLAKNGFITGQSVNGGRHLS